MVPVPFEGETYPFLEFVLAHFRRQGISEVLLCIGHLGDQITAHFGDGGRFGLNIRYDDAGTADTGFRAFRASARLRSGSFLLSCGDTFLPLDAGGFLGEFDRHPHWEVQLAVVDAPNTCAPNVALDAEGRVTAFGELGQPAGRVGLETGTMAIRRPALEGIDPGRSFSLTGDLYPELIRRGSLGGMRVAPPFFDIGTPAGYRAFCAFAASGGARPISLDGR